VAATIDSTGKLLGVASFPATGAGYRDLLAWMRSWGDLESVGVEGTGSYGAGLARHLAASGVAVVEVICANRQARRRAGKSDPADAEAAARAVLCGEATVLPKSADGPVEAMRLLRATRRSAVKARTQAINQLKGHLVTVPEQIAAPLRGLSTGALVNACARLRPNPAGGEVLAAARQVLRALACRYRALTGEIKELDTDIARLCAEANPALLAAPGVGTEVAATLLIAAGDNPERLNSEASFAALCGATPIEASSGQITRHRLNRGGDRQANNALWRIALVRLRCDERTKAYAQRRTAQGKSRKEIIRCLKRYISPRNPPTPNRPATSAPRHAPAPTPAKRKHHHRRRRTSHQHPHQPALRTRTRNPPQPRPRRPLPQLANPTRHLTNIGASIPGEVQVYAESMPAMPTFLLCGRLSSSVIISTGQKGCICSRGHCPRFNYSHRATLGAHHSAFR